MNRFDLFQAMIRREVVTFPAYFPQPAVKGVINAIEMEDGSGYSFNVAVQTLDKEVSIYVRCRDSLSR